LADIDIQSLHSCCTDMWSWRSIIRRASNEQEFIYRRVLYDIESKLQISHSFKFNDLIELLPGSGASALHC